MKNNQPLIYKVPASLKLSMKPYHIRSDTINMNSRIVLHHHEFYELFLVMDGPLTHLLNNAEYLLKPKTLVLIRPDDLHTFRCPNPHTPSAIKNISFIKPLFIRACEMFTPEQTGKIRQMSQCCAECMDIQWNTLLSKIQWLETEQLQQQPGIEQLLLSLIMDAISILLPSQSTAHSVPKWLLNAMHAMLVQENYCAGLPRFVELCGHSAEHVSRSMKKYQNCTPSSFINQTRLNAAAHLLKTTKRSVTDILFDVGYESVSHFTREFKKNFGISARDYRNNVWRHK